LSVRGRQGGTTPTKSLVFRGWGGVGTERDPQEHVISILSIPGPIAPQSKKPGFSEIFALLQSLWQKPGFWAIAQSKKPGFYNFYRE
jgi:hypothetical protein